MSTRKPGPGRKSKGDRKVYRPQLPADVHARVEHEAALRGLSLSEYLALSLAQFHGMTVEMPSPLRALDLFEPDENRLGDDDAAGYVTTRIPAAVSRIIERESVIRQNIPKGRYVALAIAIAHGFDVELPARDESMLAELDLGLEVAIGA